MGYHRSAPGPLLLLSSTGLGLASPFLWMVYRRGRRETCMPSFSGFCFAPIEPIRERGGEEGPSQPEPTEPLWECVIDTLVTIRWLPELTAVLKLLDFGESSA